MFIGYFRGEAFRILTNSGKRVIESKDLIFDEKGHSNISQEHEQVIEFDMTNPNELIDNPNNDKDENGTENEARQIKRIDNKAQEKEEMTENDGNVETRSGDNDERSNETPVMSRSERTNAGCPPIRYGFEQCHLM